MAKTATKNEEKPIYGTCRECAKSYDYHEPTAYPPYEPFLCKCPDEKWSQFLDHRCTNGKFVRKQS